MNPSTLVTTAATLATLLGVSTAVAAGQDHRGSSGVCATSGSVEAGTTSGWADWVPLADSSRGSCR